MDFGGRHIAVTGASSGHRPRHREAARRARARVSLLARRKETLDAEAARIGANAAGFAADVGDKDQLERALDAAAAHFGPVQGLFANAGLTGGFIPAVDFPAELFEQTLRVNLTSVFWAIQKVLPAMIEAGGGRDPRHRQHEQQARHGAEPRLRRLQARPAGAFPGDRGRDGAAGRALQLHHPRLHPHRGARPHPRGAEGPDRGAHPAAGGWAASRSWPKSPPSC